MRHALRNALIAPFTVIMLQINWLLSGVIVVEFFFAYKGFGAVLLEADDPTQVVGRTRDNVLEPREPYELTGQVPNVVFPSGMIVEDCDDEGFALPDSSIRIDYGAADTCIGLVTTTVDELIEAARR